MKEKETYVKILNEMIKAMTELLGSKVALICARRAPLIISPEGKVEDFYGEGKIAVETLLKQYEEVIGEVCHEPIRKAIKPIIEKKRVELPKSLE
ncbi:MAG: hypothetical protein ACP5O8_03920 [Candidatus Aenigmatarchaeota archaeon]